MGEGEAGPGTQLKTLTAGSFGLSDQGYWLY